MTIAGIVTFIAWYNYTYMKSVWVWTQESPTVYRYTGKLYALFVVIDYFKLFDFFSLYFLFLLLEIA